jgi:hypothetical protein
MPEQDGLPWGPAMGGVLLGGVLILLLRSRATLFQLFQTRVRDGR